MNGYPRVLTRFLRAGSRCVGNLALAGLGLFHLSSLFRARKSGKQRVAFQAYAVHLAQFYVPLISVLRKDPRLELSFIIYPHHGFSTKEQASLRHFAAAELGLPPTAILPYWKTLWEKFDMVVCLDVFAGFPLRPTRKVLLAHGPVLSQRQLQRGLLRKTIRNFDLLLVAGPFNYDQLQRQKRNRFPFPRVYTTGLPHLDRLREGSNTRDAYIRSLAFSSSRKIVLYAPHWSSLQQAGERALSSVRDTIEALASMDVNIIVKLHHLSFSEVGGNCLDWRKILQALGRENVRVDERPDDMPALLFSDLLISDASTRLVNYMALDKPAVLYAPGYKVRDTLAQERQTLLQAGAYETHSLAQLQQTVTAALRCPEAMCEQRRQTAEQCFAHLGEATQEVVRLLMEEIGITAFRFE